MHRTKKSVRASGKLTATRTSSTTALSFAILDSVKQHGRFTDNHLGRSTGMIVGRYPVMVVAPCC